jgi:hypothetical protein
MVVVLLYTLQNDVKLPEVALSAVLNMPQKARLYTAHTSYINTYIHT